jgi:phosphate-selective porin
VLRALIVTGLLLNAAAGRAQDDGEVDGADAKPFEWEPIGSLQLDARSYSDWKLEREGRMEREGIEVRRLRAGVRGAWRSARFEFEVDPLDDDGVFVKDARIEYRFAKSIRLRAGHFKLPGGREYDTSSRRLAFLERSPLSGSLAAGRDVGGQLELRAGAKLLAQVGLFAGDGLGRQSRAGATMAARAEWEPVADLDLGVSGAVSRLDGVESTSEVNGVNGRSATGYRFFDRLYVQGRRTRIGADAQWRVGPVRLNAEVLRLREDRLEQAADFSDLPALTGRAFTAQARWRSGCREIGLRYSHLTFDDEGAALAVDGVRPRVENVRARGVEALSASAGWQATRWLAVLGEGSAEWYSEATSAPEPGRTGAYWTLGLRLQISSP